MRNEDGGGVDDGWYGKPVRPYRLEVRGRIVARLEAPPFEDQFWASWLVRPLDADCDRVVRDPLVWQKSAFRVLDEAGEEPNELTFSGGYGEFCGGETDRLWFRSLWPAEWMPQEEPERRWSRVWRAFRFW